MFKRRLRDAVLAGCLSLAVLAPAPIAQAQDAGSGALFNAIRDNDLDAVKQIVSSGADPRARNENGVSAPQAAVRLGHHTIAHFLLAYRRPKVETAPQDAIDAALDRAIAETETPADPTPDAPEASASVPDPVPAPAEEIADLRDSPAVPPQDAATPVIEPVVETAQDSQPPSGPPDMAPMSLNPDRMTDDVLPGGNSALPPPVGTTAETPEAPEPTPDTAPKAEDTPAEKPGMLARAKGWLGGLLGFGEDSEPEQTAQVDTPPGALTPPTPADADALDASPETAKDNVPLDTPGGTPTDLDRLAAQNDPALDGADPGLPEADLPAAIADAPMPADPLADALAMPDGDGNAQATAPDGSDPLLSLLGDPMDAKPAQDTAKVAPGGGDRNLDLMAMAPKDRLAWLDKLLSKPVSRDAEDTLSDSKDEALSHLRERARRKAAEIEAAQAALSAEEKANLKTDTSAVDGPPPGTNTARRLKIPLPPPTPDGRKNFARDPWFRDVSPDEPDVRAAHRSLKAAPPERGTPPDATPNVPQLNNLPKDLDEHGGDRVAAAIPAPPPIRDTSPPPGAAAAASPSPALARPGGGNDPLEQQLSALEDQFRDKPAAPPATRGEKVPNPLAADPLAAELGLDSPSPASASDDPLAAELGLDNQAPAPADPLAAELGLDSPAAPSGAAASDDPLAAELGLDAPAGDTPGGAAANDPLAQALGDLLGSTAPNPAEAEPPKATPSEILAALPQGSEVRLDAEGRPVLPAAWTLPVVLPGQAPPVQDLASAYITPASFRADFDRRSASAGELGPLPPGANAASAWPVTKIQMADGKVVQAPEPTLAPANSGPRSALANQGQPLEGVTLSLGAGTSLYNTFVPANAAGSEGVAPECIDKAEGRTKFCIKELQWPAYLEPSFLVSTILYTGTGSVVRFDDGAPTRMQVVFGADGFDEIADWLVRRFGPPTATVTRSVAPFGQTRRDNPTMIWRALDRVTQKTVSLEIRRFDDTRDGFPDIRNGVMMLYREGTPGIFPQVSVHELMRLKRTG